MTDRNFNLLDIYSAIIEEYGFVLFNIYWNTRELRKNIFVKDDPKYIDGEMRHFIKLESIETHNQEILAISVSLSDEHGFVILSDVIDYKNYKDSSRLNTLLKLNTELGFLVSYISAISREQFIINFCRENDFIETKINKNISSIFKITDGNIENIKFKLYGREHDLNAWYLLNEVRIKEVMRGITENKSREYLKSEHIEKEIQKKLLALGIQ